MKAPRRRDIGKVRSHNYFLILLLGGLLLPLLQGCGEGSKHKPERQVIAKVNGSGITVSELDEQIARIESRAGLDAKIGKKQVLDSLVDEKLLMQKAIEGGLDREPETIAALDRARRQVLAQAVIDHSAEGGRIGNRETKAFYESHPDLFERRRIYVFRRFDLPAGELQPAAKAELGRAETPMEVGLVLKRANVKYSDQTEVRPAEMLPTDVLKQAAEMRRGDILIFREARQTVLMQLLSSLAAPVDLVHAAPSIRAHLANGRRKNAMEILLKDLRQRARIEYSEGPIDGFQLQADAGKVESLREASAPKGDARESAVSRSK